MFPGFVAENRESGLAHVGSLDHGQRRTRSPYHSVVVAGRGSPECQGLGLPAGCATMSKWWWTPGAVMTWCAVEIGACAPGRQVDAILVADGRSG